MKQIAAKLRSWRGITLLLSSVALAAVSIAITSGASATSNSGGTASENAPAPGASGVVTSGPELSPTDADALARSFAATQAGEPNPSSQIAVKADRDSAEATVMRGSRLPDTTPETIKSWDHASVYVETMRGHFTLPDASVPQGEPTPTGNALTLIIDAHTGQVSSIALTQESPSRESLEHMGNVRHVASE
ncbi:MAG: hypothetical protein ACLPKW_28410 [Acetobacteraceae bacterium]